MGGSPVRMSWIWVLFAACCCCRSRSAWRARHLCKMDQWLSWAVPEVRESERRDERQRETAIAMAVVRCCSP
ncbi:hypothetical protein GGI35DRAFT_44738 [Trichoderma velutinum]